MTTPFLGLNTWDTASGSVTTFLDFRLGLAGNSGNMATLDNYLNNVSASVSGLTANRTIAVNATQILPNYYEATVPAISTYTTNMAINLSLNTAISGSPTININSLGVKALKKTNISGTKLSLASGDLYANQYVQFIYDGTDFVWVGSILSATYSGSGAVNVSGSVISLNSASLSGSTTFNQFTVDTWGRILTASFVASGSASYTGSNVITVTGSVISHNTSGVSTGSYNVVYVDSRGHVTTGCNVASSGASYSGSDVINITGSVISHNASGVSSGSYNAVLVDSRGHVTAGSVVSYSGGTTASSCTIWEPMAKSSTSGSYNDEFDDESVSGSWTIFNPSSLISVSEDARGLVITSESGTPGEVCGIYKQIDFSGDCTVWTRVFNIDEESTEHSSGLWLSGSFSSASATSPIYTITLLAGTSGSQRVLVNSWTDYQNLDSTVREYNVYRATGIYLRVRISLGNSMSVDISENGVGWRSILNEHVLPFNPNEFGLVGMPGNYVYTAEQSIFSFFRFVDVENVPHQITSGCRIKVFNK